MLDRSKLNDVIEKYKRDFNEHWKDEKYKWEAVKHFQDNCDINAENFGEMFKEATGKTSNLLASGYAYPRAMILELAKADDNAVREMFRRLYDESLDLSKRVTAFIDTAEELRNKYNDGTWKQHYQNTNYISTYLWLMYPDKYYIYKYELFKKCAETLDDTYRPKGNGAVDNVIGGFKMYDEIREALLADDDIRSMLDSVLTDSCYADPELVTATIDFGFYLARFYIESPKKWFPPLEEYTPGVSVEDWLDLLNNKDVFDESSLIVIQRFYEIGGQATCSELAQKYGNTAMHYSGIVSGLAKRIHKKTDCPVIKNELGENSKWWPILFVGKDADKQQTGAYVWKLRDELREALDMLHDNNANNINNTNAWLLAWNPKNYDWENDDSQYSLETMFRTIKNGGGFYTWWRCVSSKIKCGDLVYMIKLGAEPKGIIAKGYAIGESFIDDNIRFVEIILTKAIDYRKNDTDIISQQQLKELFPEQQWSPQGSGISIKPEAAKWLIYNFNNYSPSCKEDELVSDNEYTSNAPVIWKISHGTNSTGVSKELRDIFEKRKVVTMNRYTHPLATSKISQGESFMTEIKSGDYFYLCYGGEIVLFGQFLNDSAKLNPEITEQYNDDNWYEREYKLIAESKDRTRYNGIKKWWTPNHNSTCVKVTDNKLFEELILQPYFGLTLEDLQPPNVYSIEQIKDFYSDSRTKNWFAPIIEALHNLGGNADRHAVHQKIIEMYSVSKEELAKKHKSGHSIVLNDIDWARNYLTYEGFLDSDADSGIWCLTDIGKTYQMTEELAQKIIRKWVLIKAAERNNTPIPVIDLTPFYKYRIEKYTKQDFLKEAYMTEEQYTTLTSLLEHKQNIILQGAPGVGKTFTAKRLAYSMMGEKDDNRIEFIQFHQSYSYEDFIMGYRPDSDNGFELKEGVFYRFCEKARKDSSRDYFFIIDEINRGNLSKIFGELLMLIEKDYRRESATLAYRDEKFYVPENLYIIGMMNTADRSLAMIDYALRRRFSFFEMEPGFDSDGFKKYSDSLNSERFKKLIEQIKALNKEIEADTSLGKGFCIGHSYLCNIRPEECTDEKLKMIVEYDIIPMLNEYWFDDKNNREKWSDNLRGIFNDS